eukprot:jgi/Mesvir1/9890/Mv22418-RA.1
MAQRGVPVILLLLVGLQLCIISQSRLLKPRELSAPPSNERSADDPCQDDGTGTSVPPAEEPPTSDTVLFDGSIHPLPSARRRRLQADPLPPLVLCDGSNLTFTDVHESTATAWSDTLIVPQFDARLGPLLSVYVHFSGSVFGNVAVESLDATPVIVTSTLSANLVLYWPGQQTRSMLALNPGVSRVFDSPGFDGRVDFSGTSGRTYAAIEGRREDSMVVSSDADLAYFKGPVPGAVFFNVLAMATSTASGSGNVITQFRTFAAATVTVIYDCFVTKQVRILVLCSRQDVITEEVVT